jgi:hypothetical protein
LNSTGVVAHEHHADKIPHGKVISAEPIVSLAYYFSIFYFYFSGFVSLRGVSFGYQRVYARASSGLLDEVAYKPREKGGVYWNGHV